MSTFVNSTEFILSIYQDSTSAYKPIGCLNSTGFAFSNNVIETETKCEPGIIRRRAGSTSIEIPFEGTYIEVEADKFNFADFFNIINDDSVDNITFKMDTDNTTFYGSGVISDFELTAPEGVSDVTFSGTIQLDGLLTTTDPKA